MEQQIPTTSIITCVYNGSKFIAESINGVLKQDYPNNYLQYVIIDDNSTDNTSTVIHNKLFKQTPHNKYVENGIEYKEGNLNGLNIFYIRLPQNVGPSAARNVGMKKVFESSHLFQILDSDDIFYPQKISRGVQKMMEAPNAISCVYSDYDIYNVDNKTTVTEFKEIYSQERLNQENIVHSNSLINKMFLEKVLENGEIYDPNLRVAEDLDLWLRLSECSILVHIAEPLMKVNVHQNNSTNAVNKEIWNQCWQRVAYKTQQRRNN